MAFKSRNMFFKLFKIMCYTLLIITLCIRLKHNGDALPKNQRQYCVPKNLIPNIQYSYLLLLL